LKTSGALGQTHQQLAQNVRAVLAARIAGGELQPGDRLPAERELSAEFGVTRTVIRQALAGLARDGMIVSAYPRGYDVLAPRIPWLSAERG
jgi:DNA-binding FadR family transcriptional regulator